MRKPNLITIVAGLMSVLFLSAAASAKVTWDQVKKKADGANSYSVIYKYSGPRGKYDFDYAYTKNGIRSEITDSSDRSKIGTVIIYDKSWNPDRVRAKVGGGMIVRNNTHKDVVDTPFYRSLYSMIFGQTDKLGKPTASENGSDTVFTFKAPGGYYKVTANNDAEIVKTERKDGRVNETRRFLDHKWNNSPKVSF